MEAAAAEPETLKVEDAQQLLGDQLVEEMPEAQPAAAAAAQQESAEKQPIPPPAAPSPGSASAAAPTDAQGNLFSPLLHECDEAGNPVFRSDGKTLKRRRTPLKEWKTTSTLGSVPEAAPAAGEPAAEAPAEPADEAKQQLMMEAGAATITGAQLLLMRMALGDECGTQEGERQALMAAWVDVMKHYGMSTMHPIIGVAVVSGMIGFKAYHQPANKSRIEKLRDWFQRQALWAWQKVRGRKAAAAAPATPGEAPAGA